MRTTIPGSDVTSGRAGDPQRGALSRVNIQIAGLEERVQASGEPLPLICECAQTGCTTPIEVEPAVFQAVREHPLRYLLAPGHERPELEAVIERHNGYLIVEKRKLSTATR